MSRTDGTRPDFEKLHHWLDRAEAAWSNGDLVQVERCLNVLGSVALSEARGRRPGEPVPE